MGLGCQARFVDWEERFVAHDRGSRVVHYYLRDRQGNHCLAVIGTERSLRHMVYVVSDDFLPLANLDKMTTSAFKWRARREVVDWLSSFLSKAYSLDTVVSAGRGSPQNVLHSFTDVCSAISDEGPLFLDSSRQEVCRSRLQYTMDTRKHFSILKADVIWVGSSWSCRKGLRHFHSFQRNGITISVQDFVYVMTEEKDRHIAYVEDLFEDKKLRKKLSVRWFHKTSELTCKIPPPAPHAREVFYTSFQQHLSVECVDGVATVLTPEHLDLCLAVLPVGTVAQAFICFRQFDSEGIKPFSLQDMKGYWEQTALSLAGLAESFPLSDQGSDDLEMDEEGGDLGKVIKRGPRTVRCSFRRMRSGNRILGSSGDDADGSSPMSREAIGSDSHDTRYLSSSSERNQSTGHEQKLWRYDVGDHIEMLSEDSGLRGCWFKGTVLRRSLRRLKVRYDDVLCEDGKGNLEEWISCSRVSRPCKLGIRISGRPSIRPCPSDATCSLRLNEGEVVDAWWHDGWWEGILCGKSSAGFIHVFIPGEMETAIVKSTELRVSKEWFNGSWAAIPSFPDVVMILGLSLSIGKLIDQDEKIEETLKNTRENCSSLGLKEEGNQSPVQEVKHSNITESVDLDHNRCDWDGSNSKFCSSPKEEPGVAQGLQCEREGGEEQNSLSPSGSSGRPRSGGPSSSSMCLVFHHLLQEPQNDGVSFNVKQNQLLISNPSGLGLKWKAGRKRHRQGDLLTSRVNRNTSPIGDGVKECIPDVSKELITGQGNRKFTLLEDAENSSRWIDGEAGKHKIHRQENDSSLKALQGSQLGSSLFVGSLPVVNLVMSR